MVDIRDITALVKHNFIGKIVSWQNTFAHTILVIKYCLGKTLFHW